MPIEGLEDERLSGRVSILSGTDPYLGKKLLPFPVTPKEVQASFWDMLINSIKRKLGL